MNQPKIPQTIVSKIFPCSERKPYSFIATIPPPSAVVGANTYTMACHQSADTACGANQYDQTATIDSAINQPHSTKCMIIPVPPLFLELTRGLAQPLNTPSTISLKISRQIRL